MTDESKVDETTAPGSGTSADRVALTADTLAAAERLAGLSFSPTARAMLLEDIDEQLARALSVRQLKLANQIGPATHFDPRLPTQALPHARPRIYAPRSTPLPQDPTDIAFSATLDQARWLREGELSSTALTALYLERIESYDASLNALITITKEQALAQAAQADAELAAGRWRGPLHGIPWLAKDLLATAGIPTTWGTTRFREQVPAHDATVVQRLAEQGAVLLGKTALGALAMGDVWFGGQTRNPHNTEEGSAGSSAGSAAAVAAGLASFAIGSETMGSIVNPSIRCGAVGLRPTFGRVPRTGAMALSWSLDKIGPICRDPEDTIAVLTELNGPDQRDRTVINAPVNYDANVSVEGLRMGFHPDWFESISAEQDRIVMDAIESLGVELVEVQLPDLPYDALWSVLFTEAAAAFDELVHTGQEATLERQDRFAWPNLLRKARFISAVDHLQAERLRFIVMQEMAQMFERVDLLIGSLFASHMQLITNCTGHPALAIRAGIVERPTRSGFSPIGASPPEQTDEAVYPVPHGLVLWGNLYREDQLVNVANRLSACLPFGPERPPNFV